MTIEETAASAGLRYGVEIEFACPTRAEDMHAEVQRALGPTPLVSAQKLRPTNGAETCWALASEPCTDPGSVGYPHGGEVKSRMNAPEAEIQAVLNTLARLGCRVTRKCGNHVHISHPDRPVRARLPRTEIWPERFPEVAPMTRKPSSLTHLRARGVYQFDDRHLEIRVFNSHLDPEYVIANVALCLASVAHDGENRWESVPIDRVPRAVPGGLTPAPAPLGAGPR